MNLSTILKLLGIKITPEQIAQLEIVIPQIPARAVEIIKFINQTAASMDARLSAVETRQGMILQKLDFLQAGMRDMQDTLDVLVVQTNTDGIMRPAGMGSMGKLLEMGKLEEIPSVYVNDIPEVQSESNGTDRSAD